MALMSMCWKQDIKDEKYRKDTRVNCTLGDLAPIWATNEHKPTLATLYSL